MLSFEGFAARDGVPIYLQIIAHVKRGIVAGSVRDGDEMPSRRVLSALLGVNPNTVQRAYRLLEEEGLASSHAGAKSFIKVNEGQLARIRGELLEETVLTAIAALREMGVAREEALELVERLWDKEWEVAEE